jgi:ribonuclease P protein component
MLSHDDEQRAERSSLFKLTSTIYMLPSSKRLSVTLFASVLANGKIVHSTLFTARILKTAGISRFSVAISKKIAKTAVERNKFRRRVYSAISMIDSKIPQGFHVILMGKPPLIKATPKDTLVDLESLFVKSGLIK